MRTACLSLLVCGYLAAVSAFIKLGLKEEGSVLLFADAENHHFAKGKPRIFHFNTCKEYDIVIDLIEISTIHGRTLEGTVIKGGTCYWYLGLELYGNGPTNFFVRVWGRWVRSRQTVSYTVGQYFENWWKCNHEIPA